MAHGRLAASELRLQAARANASGVQVMTFEQLALRLAGGFAQAIDDDVLHEALADALVVTSLGELDAIKLLPGMISAAADTLKKAWRSGVDLAGRSSQHPRLEALARLE
ncbi:MAG: PD-(D/E)XK nuclease family protein, partial [Sphingomonadaceae bacterium]|nr:PD-(D/E)XK nuclease family protein [Sphingomonadaceae bacterium]